MNVIAVLGAAWLSMGQAEIEQTGEAPSSAPAALETPAEGAQESAAPEAEREVASEPSATTESESDSAADDGASAAAAEALLGFDAPTDSQPGATSQPAPDQDHAFFDGDLESAFSNLDTEWKDDKVIEQETAVFVGPPSPYSLYKKLVKHDVFSLKLRSRVLASVQEVQDTRLDGFELRQLRASVKGRLGDFSYFSQVEATQDPALVDAIISYRPAAAFGVAVGRMKTPFSGEYLTSRPDLSFIERSEMVLATAPMRSVGVKLLGDFFGRRLRYQLGAYNSRGLTQVDWGRQLLYVGRVGVTPLKFSALGQSFGIDIAANAAYGWREVIDFVATRPLEGLGSFSGSRLVIGADTRITLGPGWLAGELIYASFDGQSSTGRGQNWAAGGYAEAGAEIIRKRLDFMLRYDALYAYHADSLNQFVLTGFRIDATEFLRFQINYAWGTGGGDFWSRNQVIGCLQLTL